MWDSFGFEFVNFYFIPGIVLGCIYALGAIGITLTFGILRFANFAHGEVMMTGAYVTWTLMAVTGALFGWVLHPLIAAIPAIFVMIKACYLKQLFPSKFLVFFSTAISMHLSAHALIFNYQRI